MYSVAREDVTGVLDEAGHGLAFTGSKTQLGLTSWKEVLEHCTTDMQGAPFDTIASAQAANLDIPQHLVLGDYLGNALGLSHEDVASALGKPFWQVKPILLMEKNSYFMVL